MILDYVQIVHPPWEVTNDLLAQYLLLWFVSFQMMMFPFEHGVFFLAWFMLFIFNCMMSKPTKGEAGIMLRLLWSQHLNANIWEFSSIDSLQLLISQMVNQSCSKLLQGLWTSLEKARRVTHSSTQFFRNNTWKPQHWHEYIQLQYSGI